MSREKTYWPGFSGKEYQYWIYPIGTTFKEVPGTYIFAIETGPGKWLPCYIGQTKNLDQRLENHEREACAKRNGATHIHVHVIEEDEDARLFEVQDLILRWRPPCNGQYAI